MKKTLGLLALILAVGLTTAVDAEAKRLGGGKSSGMQRDTTSAPAPARNTPSQTPAQQQAAPATAGAPAAGAAAGAAQKRSWMGPVAGLAAGLGLMALASHFGFGEALANFMMIALLVMAVLVVVGLVMRRRAAGASPAMAGAGAGASSGARAPFGQTIQQRTAEPATGGGSLIGSRIGSGLAPAAAPTAGTGTIPAGFDAEGFARNAKANFMDLQSANDAGDLGRLREYLTPEMYEAVREEVLERGGQPQTTEVFGLQAQVIDVAQDANGYMVSVRFTGSVRTHAAEVPQDLDEVWHLAKPASGNGGWVVAGIQQA